MEMGLTGSYWRVVDGEMSQGWKAKESAVLMVLCMDVVR